MSMSESRKIETIPETPAVKAALATLLAEIRKAKGTAIHSGTFAQHKESRAATNRLGVALIRLLEEQAPLIAEQVAAAYAKATGREK
jgi:hypothetical protein